MGRRRDAELWPLIMILVRLSVEHTALRNTYLESCHAFMGLNRGLHEASLMRTIKPLLPNSGLFNAKGT